MEDVLSINCFNFALAGVDRCDRPMTADSKTDADQPGRLAHGPDENMGQCGIAMGFMP